MTDQREWLHWEQWEHGWEVRDGHLFFEDEDITALLPPHLVEPDPTFTDWVPQGPAFHPGTDPRDFLLRFMFENGWEAVVYPDYSVALNAASISGINRRVLGPRRWPLGHSFDWEDPMLAWQEDEMEALSGSYPHLDDPDHLLRCLAEIATLPSFRG